MFPDATLAQQGNERKRVKLTKQKEAPDGASFSAKQLVRRIQNQLIKTFDKAVNRVT